MAVFPMSFSVDPFPPGWKGTIDQHAQTLVQRIRAHITAQLLTGQVGGTQPISDVGLWVKDGTEIWVWNEELGTYVPMTVPLSPGAAHQRRNKVINGSPQVWQLATSGDIPITPATGTLMTADCWRLAKNGPMSLSYSRATVNTSGPEWPFVRDALRVTCTTAQPSLVVNEYAILQHNMEGIYARDLWGWPTSISLLVRFWRTGIFCVTIRSASPHDYCFVTEREILAGEIANWKRITINNIPAFPTGSGGIWGVSNDVGIQLVISLWAGGNWNAVGGQWVNSDSLSTANQTNFCATTGDICDIAILQHESGPECGSFAALDYLDNLEACRRYIQKSYLDGTAPGTVGSGGAVAHLTPGGGTQYQHVPFYPRVRSNPTFNSTIWVYSPDTGTINNVRNVSTSANHTVNSISSSPGGLASIALATAPTAGQLLTYHYYVDVSL
jgi:hypothetical protein